MTKIVPSTEPHRRGRPPASMEGEVEDRILAAAEEIFLDLGFARTTMAAVGKRASVGNTSLYNRYPSKEALFNTVMERSVARATAQFGKPSDAATASDRLRETGLRMGAVVLQRPVVAIMRVSAAEAESYPDIASIGYRLGFDASIRMAARAIAGSDDAAALERALPAATLFVELALHPLELQGIYGIDLDTLRCRVPAAVDDAIAVLGIRDLLD